MHCIRSVNGAGGGGGSNGVDRKILIKSEDSRGVTTEDDPSVIGHEQQRNGDDMEGLMAVEAEDKRHPATSAPTGEVRTLVLNENQCIVYGARTVGRAASVSNSASTTLQQLPISHLPPKKTLKLALGLRGPLSPTGNGAPPPPLALRRTSDQDQDHMLARIQIVSKAHQHDQDQPQQCGVLVAGPGVHVIKDGRFYQPAPVEQRSEDLHGETKEDDEDLDEQEQDSVREEEPNAGRYHVQQHSSIIVANGGRSSPHLGRLSPAGQDENGVAGGGGGGGGGGVVVQHPHTSSSITTTTTILVSNERASIYKPPTQATSTTTVSSSKQQQQQQQQPSNHHQHVTSMQPPPPPPPLKMSKGGGGHEEPSSSMPDLGEYRTSAVAFQREPGSSGRRSRSCFFEV
uniref:Uncharacterized protein n=1 Tax=Anopheles farauti TaxID=69004 RepID=A0A182QDA5_9DIPT